MGFFKKIFKGIGKVFKKIGKGIKKVAGKIGKAFGKLGIVGTIALGFLAPYALGAISTWAGGLAASGNAFVAGFGKLVGAATKVIGGVGKAVGSVTEAVTSTISNIVGKVAGETLKTFGIDNFMGKDLTQLDSWSQIWCKTQESFAGVKGAFTEGVTKQASLFDTAKSTVTDAAQEAVNITTVPKSKDYSIFTGEKPQTDYSIYTGEPVIGDMDKRTLSEVNKSLLSPPDTAKTAGMFQDPDPDSIVGKTIDAGKDRLVSAGVDYGAQKIFGGGDEGTGRGGLGIVSAGQVQVTPGPEVQMAFAPVENPQSSWGMRLAEMPTAYDPFGLTGRQQATELISVTG